MFRSIRENLKPAFKEVFLCHREYWCFFAALFIIESFFWMNSLYRNTNNARALEKITEEYDYHISVEGMNDDQSDELYFSTRHIKIMNEGVYSVEFTAAGKNAEVVLYETGDKLKNADRFVEKYVSGLSDLGSPPAVNYTPLLTYESEIKSQNDFSYIMLCLLLLIISVFLLGSLFSIRLDQCKFKYGIYMTYGADFKRLYRKSFWEMSSIALITYLPAAGVSLGLSFLNFSQVKVSPVFSFWDIFIVLLFTVVAVLIAVLLPVWFATRKTPLGLLAAGDNGDRISSPKYSSTMILRKPFRVFYELLAMIRYRKYYIRLILSTAAFCALFLCGMYLVDMNAIADAKDPLEFSLEALPAEHDDELAELWEDSGDLISDIRDLDGVSLVSWKAQSDATVAGSHILIKDKNTHLSSSYTVSCDAEAGYDFAFSKLSYVAADELYIDMLVSNPNYVIDGDPYSVLNKNKTVIVSENIYRSRRASFDVGDKIMIAHATRKPFISDLGFVTSERMILQKRLERWRFEYDEYTVGAVIKSGDWEDSILVCMDTDSYMFYTESVPIRSNIDVYVSSKTTPANLSDSYDGILDAVERWGGYRVTRQNAVFEKGLETRKNSGDFILSVSVGMLLICPVLWFFSQIWFYKKRNGELNTLRYLGATEKTIRDIHLVGGGVMAVISFVFSLLAGLLISYLIYKFCSVVLPFFGMGGTIEYSYSLPVAAWLGCALISVICGFLSSYLPFFTGKKEIRRLRVRRKSDGCE